MLVGMLSKEKSWGNEVTKESKKQLKFARGKNWAPRRVA
jgi:hypothetical protein